MENIVTIYSLLYQSDTKKDLTEYQKIITDSDNIQLIKSTLSEILELKEKEDRFFTAGFMIYYYADQLIKNKDLEINKEFLIHCHNLVTSFEKLSQNYNDESIESFKTVFENYLKKFADWKENDLFEMIQDFTKMYWELEMQIYSQKKMGKELPSDIIKIIKQKQESVLQKIKKFGGGKGIEYFSNYVPVIFNQESMDNVQKQVKENFDKAFWDLFEENIENKKYEQLLKTMDEIKINFKSLVPNRKDIHRQLDENMDTEFLKGMLENDVVDSTYIYNMICYIVQQIKSLEAPIDNADTETWKQSIDQQFKDGALHHQILGKFFKKVYHKLQKITKEVNMVRNSKLFGALQKSKSSNNIKII